MSAEVVYKVSLEGYWVDVPKRIWKTKDNELYHIDSSGRAVKYIENMDMEIEEDQFSDLTFSFGPAQNDDVENVENDEDPPTKKTKVI
jgi:hypothetical protein